jgi:hypothetical protein
VQDAVIIPEVMPYLPRGQPVHSPAPPVLYVPTWQSTAVPFVDPAGHAYPAGHSKVQTLVSPLPPLYVPAGQSLQAPAPASAYLPAGHFFNVPDVDPAGHSYPAEHGHEHRADVRPVADPNRPGGHNVQVAAAAREYCPAGHTLAVADVDPAGQLYPALQGPLQVEEDCLLEEP